MKKITLLVCTLSYMLLCTLATNAQWRQTSANLGGTNPVNCIAASGLNVFAGTTNSGVYLSADSGHTWNASNNGLPASSDITALTINGNNVFLGTWGGGAFLSSNNGSSWTSINNGAMGRYVSGFAINGSYIFAGTADHGIVLSTDNGNSWNYVNNNVPNGDSAYIISMAASGTRIFGASYYGGIYYSNDSGQTWLASSLASSDIYTMATSGANVYAGSKTEGAFLSTDTGFTFLSVRSVLADTNVLALATSGSSVLAGTGDEAGVFLSIDTAQYWASFNTGGLTGAIARIHSLAISALSIYAGTSGGHVWKRAASDVTTCAPAIVASDTLAFCQGDSVILSATTGTGWLWNTGATTQSIVAKTSGVYSCEVTTNCGFLPSNPVTVTVNPAPTAVISADGPLAFCRGDSVHLTASGGDSIQWSYGSNSSTLLTIRIINTVTVKLTVTGPDGCKGSTTVQTIAIPHAITRQPASQTVVTTCGALFSLTDTSTLVTTYQWQGNLGFGFLDLSNTGFYSGVITDSLIINPVSGSTNGSSYRCIVSNAGCNDTSTAAVLTVGAVATSSTAETLCAGDSLTIGNHVYTASGVYTDTLQTIAGCDSLILTTNLVLAATIRNSQTVTLCAGDSLVVGGAFIHTATGVYIDSLFNGRGCDSIVTTHLTIDSIIKHSQTVALCAGDSIIIGGLFVHDTTGTFVDSLYNGRGCDSIVTTHLTVYPVINDSVVVSSDTLIAKSSTGTYQWINCSNGDSVIATTQKYFPTADGDYAVVVTANGCSDTSSCVSIINVGIAVNTLNYSFTLYPNPATNQLTIHTSVPLSNKAMTISIMNVLGELMQEEKVKWANDVNINIGNLPAGMYFLQMKSQSASVTERFVKE